MADKLVVLFDDERSFKNSFYQNYVTLRTVEEAIEYFTQMKQSGAIIDELWLDFNLKPGCTADALHALSGSLVKSVIFHSNAFMSKSLVEDRLRSVGYSGSVSFPQDGCFK